MQLTQLKVRLLNEPITRYIFPRDSFPFFDITSVVKVYAPLNRRNIITLNIYLFLCVRGKKIPQILIYDFARLKNVRKLFPHAVRLIE